MKTIFIVILGMLFLVSCREQLVKVPEIESIESPRIVLLEELTGVSCPNCPIGTEKIIELKAAFGDNLVVVAVHGEFLARPTDENRYDFRFEEAADLEDFLKPWQGKPAASINRIQHTDDEFSVSNPQLWRGFVQQELEKEHRINIDLELTYDVDERIVDITAVILPVSYFSLDEDLKLTVMMIENEIEDAQEDNTTIIEDYEHNHVLRDFVTQWNGDPINKELFDNVEESIKYRYEIPVANEGEQLWRPEHMEIVAFIHSNANGGKRVFQATRAEIIE